MAMLAETQATKGDIAELRKELRTYYATKADIAELRGELKGTMQGIRWMIGIMGLGLAALSVVLKFLV